MDHKSARIILKAIGFENLILKPGLDQQQLGKIMTARRFAIQQLMQVGQLDYLKSYTLMTKLIRKYQVTRRMQIAGNQKRWLNCSVCGRPVYASKHRAGSIIYCHTHKILSIKNGRYTWYHKKKSLGLRSREVLSMFTDKYLSDQLQNLLNRLIDHDLLLKLLLTRGVDNDQYYALMDTLRLKLMEEMNFSHVFATAVLLEYINKREVMLWKQTRMF